MWADEELTSSGRILLHCRKDLHTKINIHTILTLFSGGASNNVALELVVEAEEALVVVDEVVGGVLTVQAQADRAFGRTASARTLGGH